MVFIVVIGLYDVASCPANSSLFRMNAHANDPLAIVKVYARDLSKLLEAWSGNGEACRHPSAERPKLFRRNQVHRSKFPLRSCPHTFFA